MTNVDYHFSTIAHKYRDLRTTDLEPILFIKKKLQKLQKVEAVDVGCGVGRYSSKIFQYLGDKLYLHCTDSNEKMLEQLKEYFTQHKIKNFQIKKAFADNLPFENDSLDCILTFNAVHHFKLLKFLKESSRILKKTRYLFIYTRLRSQNKRNIWGRYFPQFYEKETRLYELKELELSLNQVPSLTLESIEYFEYKRVASLDWLVNQAQNKHYSTFQFYTDEEFKNALKSFQQKVSENFEDLNKISWIDENILLVARKN